MRTAAWIIVASMLGIGASEDTASVPQEQTPKPPQVRVITDEVSCDSCVIERYKIATIHDREFPEGALVVVGSPHVNLDGTFLVIAGPLMPNRLYLANREGSIVRRIGRTGEGPGEYQFLSHIHETPSAYLVYDGRLMRVTRLSKTTFETLSTTSVPWIGGPVPPLVFGDGSYLFSGRTLVLPPRDLHLIDPTGGSVRSFRGDEEGTPSRPSQYPLALALSHGGRFWAADPNEYRIERWDREGNLLEVIQRETDWFTHEPESEKRRLGAPQYRVEGLFEDENGLLWVHVRGWRVSDETPGRINPDSATRASIIEVIDPVAGTLVASSRLDGVTIFSAMNGAYQVVQTEDPQGLLNIEVWGARLKGR